MSVVCAADRGSRYIVVCGFSKLTSRTIVHYCGSLPALLEVAFHVPIYLVFSPLPFILGSVALPRPGGGYEQGIFKGWNFMNVKIAGEKEQVEWGRAR